ncbi:hypothetical protein [Mesorhizobium sp. M0598]|uniref:hypothetical protein n=1 Tax=Mesorhizobium sp. M0598 TaxID=2956968 RepID=UPI00333A228C
MTNALDTTPSTIDRIRHDLVGLKMPRALEALDHIVRRLEQGEIAALEAMDILQRSNDRNQPAPSCRTILRRTPRPNRNPFDAPYPFDAPWRKPPSQPVRAELKTAQRNLA